MVEFKSKYFTAEQIKKIDDGMKLLLEKGKELDELKVVVKKLNKDYERMTTQCHFYKNLHNDAIKHLEDMEKKFKEQVKINQSLQEQIQSLKDDNEYHEINDEEFASFYDYFFTKQEKV